MSKTPRLVTATVLSVIVMAITAVIVIASGKDTADVIWKTWVEYWAALATIVSFIVILIAKHVGTFLQKPSDYYGEPDE